MKIRLNKVQKELNIGLSTIVEFLQKKGIEIKEDPNAVVPEAGYELLIQEFSADKKARKESDDFTKERLNKEKPKAAPVVEEKPVVKEPVAPAPVVVEEKKPEPAAKEVVESTPKVEAPVIKVTRRIDLDALNKRTAPQPKKEEPKKEEAPKVEPKKEEPAAPAPVVVEPKKEEPQPQLTQVDEVEAPKLKIMGQIDLAAINQSTRPKKKSKEEKKKEREEKDKQREEQRKQQREAQRHGNDGGEKKKRQRINSQRVDINDVKENGGGNNGGNNNGGDRDWSANRNKGGGNQSQGSRKDRDRQHKRFDKNDVNDEDVSKQIKETLDRLTNRGKGNKSAKYRKEKRDMVAERQMQQMNEEMEQSKVLQLTEFVTANELASMMNISVTQVIATCMSIGMMVSINQRLDAETINIVAEEFGYTTEYVSAEVANAIEEDADTEADL